MKFAPVIAVSASRYFFAQEIARAAGDRRGVVVVVAEALALEAPRDVAPVLVEDRLYDVARVIVVDLDDVFAEVGLDGGDAVGLEVVVEVDLLGDHALRLHDLLRAGGLENLERRAAGILLRHGEVNTHAIAREAGLGLFEILPRCSTVCCLIAPARARSGFGSP